MRSTAKLMAEGNSDDAIASQPTDVAKQVCLNHKDLLEFNDETESKYQLTCTTKEKLSYSFEEEWRLIYEREKVNTDGEKKVTVFHS